MRSLPEDYRYLSRLAPTPLAPVRLGRGEPTIWCKLEFLNPSGSTKDRVARHILEKAWREGRIGPGDEVIEASSGSTSIAMALTCAQLGLRFLAVMPEGVSDERLLIIRAYSGRVHNTPKEDGIQGAIAKTERLAAATGGFLPRQFSNRDNADAHRLGTAREIMEQMPGGGVDAVVSGVGTGGTLIGLTTGCSECGGTVVPIMARPVNPGKHSDAERCSFSARIPGVVDRVSLIFDEERMPGLVTIEIDDEEALATTRALIARGFPVGPSSGLNYRAAVLAAARLPPEARIVTVFPDRMERYFTTELFAPFVG
jgi:cysteine synthase A